MVFDQNEIVNKTIVANYSDSEEKDCLNVAYGIDKKYLFGAAISITSVLINNKSLNLAFHIFTDYLDNDYVRKIEQLAKEYKTVITLYIVNSDSFKKFPQNQTWTYAIYFRFIAFEILSKKLDALLYLDADVMCKGPLAELKSLDFSGCYAAVVPDVDHMQEPCFNRLKSDGLLEGNYFNSGVIYTNLKAWRDYDFMQKTFDILADEKQKGKLVYFDQDILNILFVNNVIILRRDFNCIYSINLELTFKDTMKYKDSIKESTSLIHYTDATKPWHNWANYPSTQYFYQAYNISPWKDEPLKEARGYKQFKKKSKHERLQGRYIDAIKSYMKYIVGKTNKK